MDLRPRGEVVGSSPGPGKKLFGSREPSNHSLLGKQLTVLFLTWRKETVIKPTQNTPGLLTGTSVIASEGLSREALEIRPK